jgi:acetyl coenzyme A synthetase (ADP forming)-like protein
MLDAFFRPRSVAVVGASRDPAKLGYAVVRNLVEGGYAAFGKIYPINPKADTILDLKTYPSILDVPGQIDLAVIVIPYPHVPDAMRECGEKEIPAAVVISAGFREAGKEGLERERELTEIAKTHNIRLIGPNCLGVIDTFTPLNASFAADTPPKGPMAFMSQSGALGIAILDWALGGQLGFSKFVSLGNKADVNEIDLLEAWADDPDTNVILVYSEGLPDGQAFIRTAREASKKKPIVAVKSGVTASGSRAVSSHTGSLAGSEQAYAAAFKQAGVLRAQSMEELFDFAMAFAYQPVPPGDRIAIVTNAGGPGILAADAIEHAGMALARFKLDTIHALEGYLPDAASAANPVDLLGDALADRYAFALEKVAADPNVDGLLVILTPQATINVEEAAEAIGRAAKRLTIPVVGCFMGEVRVRPGIDILARHNVPNYPFPERAIAALKAMSDYRHARAAPMPVFEQIDADREAVRQVLDKTHKEGRVTVGDAESRAILEAYGLRIPQSKLATTADEAVDIANAIGYPVVLKIASPDILHKTDVGGVKIGLNDPADVRDAFDLIVYRAGRYVPEARIWGCLVQEMIPQSMEVLVGMNRDPQFGPLVTFALGGIYVEVLKDASFRVAPFSKHEAEQMIDEIRARDLLAGVRGAPPLDKEAIVDCLLRVGQLVQDFPEILELDINPLMVFERGKGAMAVDMRLVLRS